MTEETSQYTRAQQLVGRYRSLSRELDIDDATRASTALGQMLVEVERAHRVQSDAAIRLAEEALAAANRLLHDLHSTD
jgi:hypothetical protein